MNHYIPDGLPSSIQHFIGGAFVDSVSGKTFDVLDPVSNQTYATAAAGQQEDIDLAVAAAKDAFDNGPWPRMKPRQRSRILNRIADAIEAQDARLAELECFDTGLPITQALGQAQRAAENFRFFADLIVAQADDTYKVPGLQVNYVNRKPVGVAGLITPWNTPFMLESCPRLRMHRRTQAGRVHPAVGQPLGRDLPLRRPARRRLQPRERHRRRGRRRAGQAPRRATDLLHR
jgi:5-carboxymethyl-2-hydroxymuconic-semialdehyde dehydrogenase